jgi:hypothetical protein
MKIIKAWKLNDYETYAAPTLDEAIKFACELTGLGKNDIIDDPYECDLDDEMLWDENLITLKEAINRLKDEDKTDCFFLATSEI